MHSAWNERRKPGLFSLEGYSWLNILHRSLPVTTQNTLCTQRRTLSCSPFGISETNKSPIFERPTLLRLDSQGETAKGESCELSRQVNRQQGIAQAIFSGVLSNDNSSSNTSTSLVRNAGKYACAKCPSRSCCPMATPILSSHSYDRVNLMLMSMPCSRPLPSSGKEHMQLAEGSHLKSQELCERMSQNNKTTSTAVVQYRAQHQTINQISTSLLVTDGVHRIVDTVLHVSSKQPVVHERMESDPIIEQFIHLESCLNGVLESCVHPDIFPDWVLMLCNSSSLCQTDNGACSWMLSLPTKADTNDAFQKCGIATKRHCRKRPPPRYPCRLKRVVVAQNLRQKLQPRKIFLPSPSDSDSDSVMSDCDLDDVGKCQESSSCSPHHRKYEMSHLCESVAAAMVCLDAVDDELMHWDRHCAAQTQLLLQPQPSTDCVDLSFPPLFSRQDSSSFASSFVFSPSDMSDDDDAEDDDGHDDWESSGFSSPSSTGCRHEMPDGDDDVQVDDCMDLASCQFGGLFIATSIPLMSCSLAAPEDCHVDDERDHLTGSEVKVVNPRMERLNSQWNAFYEEDIDVSTVDFSVDCSRTVHFCQQTSLVTVLNHSEWADDYEAARRGPWEEFARDRDRFERRMHEIADQIGWIFTPEHRARKLCELSLLAPLP